LGISELSSNEFLFSSRRTKVVNAVKQNTFGLIDNLPKGLLIDGEFVEAESGDSFETINPATGEAITRVAKADLSDVNRTVNAARRAFDGPWRSATPLARQQLLLRIADLIGEHMEELALLDSIDVGLPLTRSMAYAQTARDNMMAYAAAARTISGSTPENSVSRDMFTYTRKEPIGVVAAIIPWNSPFNTAIGKIGPALAAGCVLILKPAEQSPLSALRLGQLCMEAGAPKGVVNVLTGYGNIGAALAEHLDVDKVSFTGSVETGQAIIRASALNMKRLTLELGGKSPNVVFADADLDLAVPAAAMAAFSLTGQFCAAGSRLFVERSIYEDFTEQIAKFGEQLNVGDPLLSDTDLGPIVSEEQLQKVLGYVASGSEEGATLQSGGTRLDDDVHKSGYYVPPTVFSGVNNDMKIAREEIFGPVISAIPFDDVDEVLRHSNQTRYGLASGVWTRDIRKAHYLAARIESGIVWVNTYGNYDKAMPFGGYKMSGLGVENGVEGLAQYLQTKSVWINSSLP
jgi:aldehyde dehydrogenase (NAD+)